MKPELAKQLGLTAKEAAKLLPHEDDEQAIVVQWLRLHRIRFFAVPNGQKRTKREQALAKKLGMQPGVPDLVITTRPPCDGTACPGWDLALTNVERFGEHDPMRCRLRPPGTVVEMKRQKPAGAGPTEEQSEWIYELAVQGWCTRVCYGADEAIGFLMSLGYGRART